MGSAAGKHRALNQGEANTEDLFGAVLARDNLARAWKRVKANKGAPGIDGVTVQDWPAHAREHWPAVREQINTERYRPQAVRMRVLGIPCGQKPRATRTEIQEELRRASRLVEPPTAEVAAAQTVRKVCAND